MDITLITEGGGGKEKDKESLKAPTTKVDNYTTNSLDHLRELI